MVSDICLEVVQLLGQVTWVMYVPRAEPMSLFGMRSR